MSSNKKSKLSNQLGTIGYQLKWVRTVIKVGVKQFEELYQRLISTNGNTHFDQERAYWTSEKLFLSDRNSHEDLTSLKIEACELVAQSDFTIETILGTKDPVIKSRLYEQISLLENIYINQLITLDYQSGKQFKDQKGLARIHLIKFFLTKSALCDRLGIKLSNNNLNEFVLSDEELRLENIKNEISLLLKEAFSVGSCNPNALKNFTDSVTELASAAGEIVELPTTAPELYKERKDKSEKPAEFIKRVYHPWLMKGLLRPHIKSLDLPLYQNFYRQGVPEEFEILLPKAAGRSIEDIARTDSELLERRRASSRQSKRKQQFD